MSDIQKLSYYKTDAFIGGEWVSGAKRFDVDNPADGSVITNVADCDRKLVEQAVEAAYESWAEWAAMGAEKRGEILGRWAALMHEHIGGLAAIMTAEQGKPIKEAKSELAYAAGFFEWFAGEARRSYGDIIPSPFEGGRIHVIKQPVGVCGLITPWNFPAAMLSRKIGAAFAAGCPVVCKPASQTPLSALALAALAEKAGVPKGVLNIVTSSDAKMVGEVLCTHPQVAKISFTGSTAVGRLLMEQSAPQLKRLSLELGGNAPFIVFDDADIGAAVEGLMAAKFRNTGQACIAANRIYVHEAVYDGFVDAFEARVEDLTIGKDIGPLIDDKAVEKVSRLVEDARSKGAVVRLGGKGGKGRFYAPTIIEGCTPEMDLFHEEIFGPVAAFYKFSSEDEVVVAANDTEYGLAAYFYTQNLGRSMRVFEALVYGMVGVNAGAISTPVAPFGGVKQSGFGREGSKYGMDEYQNVKYTLLFE
jgi:succinate-semialdehyde dehydrogenase/glutarate-semialdehyde dehydrogenase